NDINNRNSASAELFDPDTGRWSVTASLNTIRELSINSATLLTNGKVLVIGGGAFNDIRAYAEIYDPASGTWSSTDSPSYWGYSILLPNGKVLLIAGSTFAELYDPATGRWSSAISLNIPFDLSNPTLLSDGNFLFPNAQPFSTNVCVPESAALFDYRLVPSGPVSTVSAASYSRMGLASEAIVVAFGPGLATTTSAANTI